MIKKRFCILLIAVNVALVLGLFATCVEVRRTFNDLTGDLPAEMYWATAFEPLRKTQGTGLCVCTSCGSVIDCERVDKHGNKVYLAQGR